MAYWAVARTLTRHEGLAATRLKDAGFETFAPQTKMRRSPEPLFPGYVFVRISDRWRAIDRTVGVLGLIKFGDAPAKCPDSEIVALQGRMDAQGYIRLPEPPRRPRRKIRLGAKVRVGILTAIYAGQTPRERQLVLIELLGRQLTVEVRPGKIAE
jgi:transcriptional antiterminator RfaH